MFFSQASVRLKLIFRELLFAYLQVCVSETWSLPIDNNNVAYLVDHAYIWCVFSISPPPHHTRSIVVGKKVRLKPGGPPNKYKLYTARELEERELNGNHWRWILIQHTEGEKVQTLHAAHDDDWRVFTQPTTKARPAKNIAIHSRVSANTYIYSQPKCNQTANSGTWWIYFYCRWIRFLLLWIMEAFEALMFDKKAVASFSRSLVSSSSSFMSCIVKLGWVWQMTHQSMN